MWVNVYFTSDSNKECSGVQIFAVVYSICYNNKNNVSTVE